MVLCINEFSVMKDNPVCVFYTYTFSEWIFHVSHYCDKNDITYLLSIIIIIIFRSLSIQ